MQNKRHFEHVYKLECSLPPNIDYRGQNIQASCRTRHILECLYLHVPRYGTASIMSEGNHLDIPKALNLFGNTYGGYASPGQMSNLNLDLLERVIHHYF